MIWPFRRRPAPAPAEPARSRPSQFVRSFRAARPDRLAGGFGAFPTSGREEMRREIRGLIQHARHGAQNFDLARHYEMLIRRHVIGPHGVRLQMDVWDGDETHRDKRANAAIEKAWRSWGRRGSCTVCGRLSWWAVENMVATALAREGNALIRLHRGAGRGPFGFQVEPLSFDMLDLDYSGPLAGGGWVESGIEHGAGGQIVAYHVWNIHPAETTRPEPRVRVRVSAADMLHVTVPEEIGQLFGTPRAATSLRLMNMSERYQEAAMTAAHYGAANMVFFKQQDQTGQLSSPADTEIPIDEIEAGTMAALPPGMEPVAWGGNYPDAAVDPFMRYMNTSISAGMGVAAETLTGDLSRANFSSLRAGKGEERDEWRMLQSAVIEALHDPVFSAWLPLALLSGHLPGLSGLDIDRLSAPVWRPRGWPSVNPKDDAMAHQIEIALGLKSASEIAAEWGRDYEDICADRAAERETLREYGLPEPNIQLPGVQATVDPEIDGGDDDEENAAR